MIYKNFFKQTLPARKAKAVNSAFEPLNVSIQADG